MPELKSDLAELGIYVQTVAELTGIPLGQVEKDFWLIEALRATHDVAVDESVGLIFKGGTSLSKGFNLISRFSEDVDLLVIFPDEKGPGARHTVFKKMAKAAAGALLCNPVVDGSASETGVKRPVALPYPSEFTPDNAGIRREGLYLELGSRGGTHPSSKQEIRSLISEYAKEAGLPIEFAEAEPVSIETLDPARTLIEKLLIVHNSALEGDEQKKRSTARHYYDIHCLLNRESVREMVTAVGARAMAEDVAYQSAIANLGPTDIPDGGFPSSPAFDLASNGEARDEFEDVVLPFLLWPGAERPSFEACCMIVSEEAATLSLE